MDGLIRQVLAAIISSMVAPPARAALGRYGQRALDPLPDNKRSPGRRRYRAAIITIKPLSSSLRPGGM
ncbi:MAG: hypothetical protein RBS57_17400, partial [Desulforhabdus sp.]|nr:hypothetical protein [Desulforhabdus sp.]